MISCTYGGYSCIYRRYSSIYRRNSCIYGCQSCMYRRYLCIYHLYSCKYDRYLSIYRRYSSIYGRKPIHLYCIYVAIGQKRSTVASIYKTLTENNAMENTNDKMIVTFNMIFLIIICLIINNAIFKIK